MAGPLNSTTRTIVISIVIIFVVVGTLVFGSLTYYTKQRKRQRQQQQQVKSSTSGRQVMVGIEQVEKPQLSIETDDEKWLREPKTVFLHSTRPISKVETINSLNSPTLHITVQSPLVTSSSSCCSPRTTKFFTNSKRSLKTLSTSSPSLHSSSSSSPTMDHQHLDDVTSIEIPPLPTLPTLVLTRCTHSPNRLSRLSRFWFNSDVNNTSPVSQQRPLPSSSRLSTSTCSSTTIQISSPTTLNNVERCQDQPTITITTT